MTAVYLNRLGIVCALGEGEDAVAAALFADDAPHGVAGTDSLTPGRTLALGVVGSPLPSLEALPRTLRGRNNALLERALEPLRDDVAAAVA